MHHLKAASMQRQDPVLQNIRAHNQKVSRLTESSLATPYGGDNFFAHCSDEIMGLFYRGQMGILDLMNFQVTNNNRRDIDFITYVRPNKDEGSLTAGYISDPCSAPNGIDYGHTSITYTGFGRIGRGGPTRDIMDNNKLFCDTYPRHRLDGTRVTDEREWDMARVMDVVTQDVRRLAINGNNSTSGQFDGLEQWVSTSYPDSALDSIVVDWNNNAMDSSTGATYTDKDGNTQNIGSTFGLIDTIRYANYLINQRIAWSPLLRGGQTRKVLVMPKALAYRFLDYFTYWYVLPGTQYNENATNTFEARTFRDGLNGGAFGDGVISLGGDVIDLMCYEEGLLQGTNRADVYMLTIEANGYQMWEGEHLDARQAIQNFGGLNGANLELFDTDGGRIVGAWERDELCTRVKMWVHPRMFCKAPWAQVRIQDVKVDVPLSIISGDPTATSFSPTSSFDSANT